MANCIQLTSQQLKSKKEELESLNAKFSANLSGMDSTERSIASSWDGDAAEAFEATYRKDVQKVRNMYTAVKNYCKALDEIIALYEKTENANVRIVSK